MTMGGGGCMHEDSNPFFPLQILCHRRKILLPSARHLKEEDPQPLS